MPDTSELTLAIIGCGRPWKTEGATGFGMSNEHMKGYGRCPGVRTVALCDISVENAKLFRERNALPADVPIYADYHHMLAEVRPDVVSISTWPHLHAPMVIAAAEAGAKAVHCEKPMGVTYGESVRMVGVCDRTGTQLTFNHQRRFNPSVIRARELLRSGAIGTLQRMEAAVGNLYDWGTHCFDLMFYFNDETPAEWVVGQIDLRGTHNVFGAPCEGQGLSWFKFKNDVRGLMACGFEQDKTMGQLRLIGSDGQISLHNTDAAELKVWANGSGGWETVTADTPWPKDGPSAIASGVIDLIDALRNKREPELSGHRALRATELIFGTYESSRRRGRVDLPLAIDDSPLLAMLGEAGMLPLK